MRTRTIALLVSLLALAFGPIAPAQDKGGKPDKQDKQGNPGQDKKDVQGNPDNPGQDGKDAQGGDKQDKNDKKDKKKDKSPDDEKLGWCIDENVTLVYQVSDMNNANEAPDFRKARLVAGIKLNADGSNDLDVNAWGDIPVRLLFTLPGCTLNEGDKWPQSVRCKIDDVQYDINGHFKADRRTTFSGEDCWLITGAFEIDSISLDRRERVIRTRVGHVDTLGYYKIGETLLLLGRYDLGANKPAVRESKQVKYLNAFDLDTVEGIRELSKAAVARGQEWLAAHQADDGSFASGYPAYPFGTTALALSALLQSGTAPNDPSVSKGFAFINSKAIAKTYDAAMLLMAIEGKYLPLQNYEDVLAISDRDAQATVWARVSGGDKNLVVKALNFLEKSQLEDGHWGYPEVSDTNDNSNTQIAALGLRAACRLGRKVDPIALRRLAVHFLATQQFGVGEGGIAMTFHPLHSCSSETKKHDEPMAGGWGYRVDGKNPTLAMTGAGLVSLMTAYLELRANGSLSRDQERDILKSMHSGLAWFSHKYHLPDPENAKLTIFSYYYLYTLANVGMIYRVQTIKDANWYRDAAGLLIKAMSTDGGWRTSDDKSACECTSFALLFLQKALLLTETP